MFNELKGDGRVWIYTSNRALNPNEVSEITEIFNDFCSQWSAHGSSLKSAFKIFNNQLLVLAVDEAFEAASGCSIDSSVEVFRRVDSKYQLDLFNRLNLAFLIDNQIKIIQLAQLNTAHQQGLIGAETILVDNTISSLDQLRNNWHKPLANSWAASKISQLA